jgi:hypothetical protein
MPTCLALWPLHYVSTTYLFLTFTVLVSLIRNLLKVEALKLPELLKNPLVQQMYDHAQQAASQVMKDSEDIKSLWKENQTLMTEMQSICNELQSLKMNPIL